MPPSKRKKPTKPPKVVVRSKPIDLPAWMLGAIVVAIKEGPTSGTLHSPISRTAIQYTIRNKSDSSGFVQPWVRLRCAIKPIQTKRK